MAYGLAPRPGRRAGADVGAYVGVKRLCARNEGRVTHYGFRDDPESLAVYTAGYELVRHSVTPKRQRASADLTLF